MMLAAIISFLLLVPVRPALAQVGGTPTVTAPQAVAVGETALVTIALENQGDRATVEDLVAVFDGDQIELEGVKFILSGPSPAGRSALLPDSIIGKELRLAPGQALTLGVGFRPKVAGTLPLSICYGSRCEDVTLVVVALPALPHEGQPPAPGVTLYLPLVGG